MSRWLITRPETDSQAVAAALAARGHRSVVAPILTVTTQAHQAPDLGGIQAVLFTSANGARAFARAATRRDLPVLAVGDATAATARAAGFSSVDSAGGDVDDLARLAAARLSPADGDLLHVCGSHRAGDLQALLGAAGFTVRRSVLYSVAAETTLPEAAASAIGGADLAGVLLFSPRTAAVFDTLVDAAGLTDRLADLTAVCLSEAVAAQLDKNAWGGLLVAERPELSALLALIDAAG